VGGSLFLLSDRGTLVRASASTGEVIWLVQLPQFTERKRLFRSPERGHARTHYGPVLAGGRLWVASGDGFLRAFNPTDGLPLGQIALPGGAAASPVVAGGVMYVVTEDGTLAAFQ
jgi:outer membrane protein assembly factor BamB